MEAAPTASPQLLPVHALAPGVYAGFWRRAMALCIDVLVVGTFHVLFTLVFGTVLLVPWALLGGGHGEAMARLVDIALQPVGIVIAWLYFAACEASAWQATPGKRVLGLVVTDPYGQRIGFARASGRHFGKFLSALAVGVGFMLAGWTARKQALHDFMAGCCVVRRRGLVARQGTRDAQPAPGSTSIIGAAATTTVPGWAVALIVVTSAFFLVIPLLVILAASAMPAYQNHALRAEVAEGIRLTERPRALVGEYIGQRGALPASNADLGLPQPRAIHARYVTSVRVAGGKVVITYGNQASAVLRGGHMVMAPQGNAERLRWRCSSPDIHDRYWPGNCR